MKKEELIAMFHEDAFQLIDLLKQKKENTKEWWEQYRRVFNSFKDIPGKEEDANYEDIRDAVTWASMTLKKPFREITKDEFISYLNSKLFSPPRIFDFYFRLGETSGFREGYALGNGKLYPFDKLPSSVQQHFRAEFQYRLDYDRAYGGEKLEDYTKRREREWYLYLQVQSVGHYKAREKAIINAKMNINILKLVSDLHGPLFEFDIQSPFDYQFQVNGSDWTGGGGYQRERQSAFFYRREFFDEMISDINSMVNSKNPTDMEKRILNVIDVFGLIDDLTPLHVRFLLCIISLENLLLDERDYLGWKLAEKMSYLVGDSPAWFATYHKMGPEDVKQKLTDAFMKENLTRTRIALDRTIRKFYDKRSGFAHGGLETDPNKRIIVHDYNLASSLLRWTVQKLLELRRKNGIDHIAIRTSGTEEDTTSLNYYVEKLKYA